MTDTTTTVAGNLPEYSVSEISQAVKRTLEGQFEHVRVRGEISGFKRAASGHLYMALKDEAAVLDAVCWRGVAGRLGIQPEDGMEIIVTGRITSYPARSRYQIVIESMELAGEGALLKLLEDRKKKLAAEGLFEEARKKPLPFLPEVIGVVTSPTGAVIRDILHRLAERFPRHVLLWPVLVQGQGAAEQIAAAIEGFNNLPATGETPRPDLLIVARGGGSLEDLWAFNEEIVVRAAAASTIPLISAVGHETDTTLIDYASDRRAPTPTAAAEIAVPVRRDLLATVLEGEQRMLTGMNRLLEEWRIRVEGLGRGLPDPRRIIEDMSQRLDDRIERFGNAMAGFLKQRRDRVTDLGARLPHPQRQIALAGDQFTEQVARLLAVKPRLLLAAQREVKALARVLESTSHKKILARGFALVHGPEGLLTRAEQVAAGMTLDIEFANNGHVAAIASDGASAGRATTPPAKAKTMPKGKTKPSGNDPQGSLL